MSTWPEPYPTLLATLWRELRTPTVSEAPPPLPAVSADEERKPADDPFWAAAFSAYLGRIFEWRYLTAATLAGTAGNSASAANKQPVAKPLIKHSTESTVSDASATAAAPAPQPAPTPPVVATAEPAPKPTAQPTPVAQAKPAPEPAPRADEDAAVPEKAPPSLNSRTAAAASARLNASASAEELDVATTQLLATFEQIPRDVRHMKEVTAVLDKLDALKESPQKVLSDEGFIKRLFALSEKLGRYAAVMRNLEPVHESLTRALGVMPGVDVESEPEVVHVPSAAKVGTQTRVLRPGIRDKTGKQVVKPVVAVSSREVSESREIFEMFPVLADAFEELAPQVTGDAYNWMRKAPELIDSHAGGDPASDRAEKILRDCIRFANELAYYYHVPEYETLRSGLEKIIDELAALLRDHHGMRVFPSVAQPFREGRPAPAPFPQTVLKEVPDSSEMGTLLRIRQRGTIRAGKVEDDPCVFVSQGERFPHLAKAFRTIAIEGRRIDVGSFKAWKSFVDRIDDLILQWIDARGDDSKKEALALRYLVNHVDEILTDNSSRLREANDRIVEYLRENFDIRPLHVRQGQRLDDTIDPASFDFERKSGSGAAPQTILQIKRRAFKDANNLLIQKGLLVVS